MYGRIHVLKLHPLEWNVINGWILLQMYSNCKWNVTISRGLTSGALQGLLCVRGGRQGGGGWGGEEKDLRNVPPPPINTTHTHTHTLLASFQGTCAPHKSLRTRLPHTHTHTHTTPPHTHTHTHTLTHPHAHHTHTPTHTHTHKRFLANSNT